MQNFFTGIKITALNQTVLAAAGLAILGGTAWLIKSRLVDGNSIFLALIVMTVINLGLAIITAGRFAIFILAVTYFLYLLFFLLALKELQIL